jgi:hypothetical protein
MKLPKRTMLNSAVLAAVAFGAAHADTFAQSILVIDNFRLLHANGTPYPGSDFALLAASNPAYAGACLNNLSDSAVQYGTGNLDIAQRGAGVDLPARGENLFTPLHAASCKFGASTSVLNAGDTCQVSIAQSGFASAQQIHAVAEPATLAAFGAGLLAMAVLVRRRRR